LIDSKQIRDTVYGNTNISTSLQTYSQDGHSSGNPYCQSSKIEETKRSGSDVKYVDVKIVDHGIERQLYEDAMVVTAFAAGH
jgi:hypothetical protein